MCYQEELQRFTFSSEHALCIAEILPGLEDPFVVPCARIAEVLGEQHVWTAGQ